MDAIFSVQAVMSLVDNITAPLRAVRGAMNTTKNQASSLSQKMGNLAKNMAPVAVAAGGVLVGLGAGVKTAASFEAAVSKVGAVSQASSSEIAVLRKNALDLGAATAWSAREVAEGQKFLAMAGFKNNQVIAAMPGVLNLASAANVELGETADIASNVLSSFQMSAEKMGYVGDILTRTFTSSNTKLSGLASTIANAGSVASAANVKLWELAAMAGKLGDRGIDAAVSGTHLKIMLQRLQAPVGRGADTLTALGIATRDAAGNMLPVLQVLEAIEIKTKKMGTAESAEALKNIFGAEAIGSATAIMQVGVNTIENYAQTLKSGPVTASKVAAQQLDNLEGAVTILGSAWEGLRIHIGSVFLPVLTLLIKKITIVIAFLNKIAAHPVGQKIIQITGYVSAAIVAITAFAGAWAGLGFILPFVGSIIVGLAASLAVFFWPFTLIAAAVSTMYLIWQKNFLGLKDILINWYYSVSLIFLNLKNIIIGWYHNISPVFLRLKEVIISWYYTVKLAVKGIIAVFQNFKNGEAGLIQGPLAQDLQTAGLLDFVEIIGNFVFRVYQYIMSLKNMANTGLTYFSNFVNSLKDRINILDTLDLMESGKKIITTLNSGVSAAGSILYNIIFKIFQKVRKLLPFSNAKEGPFRDLTLSGYKLITTLISGINKAFPTFFKTVQNIFFKVLSVFQSSGPSYFFSDFKFEIEILKAHFNTLSSAFNNLKWIIKDTFTELLPVFKKIYSFLISSTDLVYKFKELFVKLLPTFRKFYLSLRIIMIKSFGDVFIKLEKYIIDLGYRFKGLINSLKSGLSVIQGTTKSAPTWIMKRAHQIRELAAARFGGKISSFSIGEAMKQAWAEWKRFNFFGKIWQQASTFFLQWQKNIIGLSNRFKGIVELFKSGMKVIQGTNQSSWIMSRAHDIKHLAAARTGLPASSFSLSGSRKQALAEWNKFDFFGKIWQQARDTALKINKVFSKGFKIAAAFRPHVVLIGTELGRIGRAFFGIFNSIYNMISTVVSKIFSVLSGSTLKVIGTIASKIMIPVSAIISVFQVLKAAIEGNLSNIGELIWPIGTILGLVFTSISGPIFLLTAIISVFRSAWIYNFHGIQEKTKAVFEYLKNIFNKIKAFFTTGFVADFVENIKSAFHSGGILAAAEVVFWGIKDIWNKFVNIQPVLDFCEKVKQAFQAGGIVEVADFIFSSIGRAIYNLSSNIGNKLKALFGTLWSKIVTMLPASSILGRIAYVVFQVFSGIFSAAVKGWGAIFSLISSLWDLLKPIATIFVFVGKIVGAVVFGIILAFGKLLNLFQGKSTLYNFGYGLVSLVVIPLRLAAGLISLVAKGLTFFLNIIIALSSALWTVGKIITTAVLFPLKLIYKAISGVVSLIFGFIGIVFNAGKAVLTTFASGIMAVIKWPFEMVKKALTWVRNLLPFSDAKEGPLSNLTYSGKAFIQTFAQGIWSGAVFLYNTVKTILTTTIGFIWNLLTGWLSQIGTGFMQGFADALSGIGDSFQPLIEAFKSVFVSLKQIWTNIKSSVSMVYSAVVDAFSGIWNIIVQVAIEIDQMFGGVFSYLLSCMQPFFDWIRAKLQAFSAWWNQPSNIMRTFGWIVGFVLGSVVKVIASAFLMILTPIKWFFQLLAWGTNKVVLLGQSIGYLTWIVWNSISNVWNNISSIFSSFNLFEAGKKLLLTFADGIKSVAMAPVNAVKKAFEWIKNLLPASDAKEGPLSSLTVSGSKIMTTMSQGVVHGAPALYNSLNNAFKDLIPGLSSLNDEFLGFKAIAGYDYPELAEKPKIVKENKVLTPGKNNSEQNSTRNVTIQIMGDINLSSVKNGQDFITELQSFVSCYE
ncbi:membrane hypothetical protein [Candidatus Magnetomoraceae bacterium gMMP-15]